VLASPRAQHHARGISRTALTTLAGHAQRELTIGFSISDLSVYDGKTVVGLLPAKACGQRETGAGGTR
jgi:hypothetical protein